MRLILEYAETIFVIDFSFHLIFKWQTLKVIANENFDKIEFEYYEILRILFNRSCIFFSAYILGIAATVKSKGSSGINEYVSSLFDQSLTWKDVEWLKSISKLPIVIKGVLTVNTALQAYEHGAAAIIVSNHGARQLDGVQATIDVLPNIGNLFFSVIYIHTHLNRFLIW